MTVLHLQHLRTDGERDTFHLKNNRRYHLGRGSNCELRILDMKMSRQHCAFEYMDDAWHLIDLGSTNGVNLDGERVKEHAPLAAGTIVQAGSVELNVIAINDHIDLAPEELMQLGEAPVDPAENLLGQDPMPTVTDEVPIAKDDNPWDGEPSFITNEGNDALNENEQTESFRRKPTEPEMPVPSTDEPAADVPHIVEPLPVPSPVPMAQSTPSPLPAAPAAAAEPAPAPEPSESALPKPTPAPMMQPKAAPKPETDAIPAKPKTASTPRTRSSGEMVITVLNRKIGPISRDIARELKKKQIMGTLTDAELDQYPQA